MSFDPTDVLRSKWTKNGMAVDRQGYFVYAEDYDRLLSLYQSNIGQPTHTVPLADYINPVKTLRDEFAMAAMTGMIASQAHDDITSEFAEEAYRYADRMLEQRLKEKV